MAWSNAPKAPTPVNYSPTAKAEEEYRKYQGRADFSNARGINVRSINVHHLCPVVNGEHSCGTRRHDRCGGRWWSHRFNMVKGDNDMRVAVGKARAAAWKAQHGSNVLGG